MSKPNILLIFTDMQRADTVHALGNPVIQTPNLDRLVREGTSFTSAYSPSPVCVPARCCLHYGIYPHKTGLYGGGTMMDDNGQSYAAVLGNNGYHTKAIGKCHFTPDRHALRGFNERVSQEEIVSDYESDAYRAWLIDQGLDPVEPHGTRGEMYYIPQVSLMTAEHHPTQWIGDRSIECIRELSGRAQPWCLFSSYIHPHPPFSPPKPWHKLYRAPMMPLPNVPDNPEALHTHINRLQNRYKYRDQGIDNNLLRNIKAYYYAAISFVDYQVGRILEVLEETGQLDNTLIVFTSDHGEYLGDYHCFGKRSMHDPSSRIPMLVRYPERFPKNERCRKPVSLVDLMPTFLTAAGINHDGIEMDGNDLKAILDESVERKAVFSQHGTGNEAIYMIVTEKWKYFYSAGDRKEFLFDRIQDPNETRNKAQLRFSQPQKEALKKELLQYLKSVEHQQAYTESDGVLDWKLYPILDQSGIDGDPDANLMFQDEPHGIFGKQRGYIGPETIVDPF